MDRETIGRLIDCELQEVDSKLPLVVSLSDTIDQIMADRSVGWLLGYSELDEMTLGFKPGELILVTGFAQSAKTQLLLSSLLLIENKARPVVWVTPDETSHLVLMKLSAMHSGIPVREIEAMLADDPEQGRQLLQSTADQVGGLVVLDSTSSVEGIAAAIAQTKHVKGSVDLVVIDYLELLRGASGYEGVQKTLPALKELAKVEGVPMVVIHQSSRTVGAGKSGGMASARYGGEDSAIILMQVYRPVDDPDLKDSEKLGRERDVMVEVVKNKRPPSLRGSVRLIMEPSTGIISEPPALPFAP